MISANNITLRVGKKALFEDVNIKFTEGNCYGLIGANGAGKSTFLKILSGQLEPTNGDVVITPGQRLSFLQQDHFKYDAYTVLDTVIMGNKRLYEIMKEKDAIYAKADFTDEDGIRASELEGEFAEMNGWEAESDAATLLNGLGIETDLHYSQMADQNFSELLFQEITIRCIYTKVFIKTSLKIPLSLIVLKCSVFINTDPFRMHICDSLVPANGCIKVYLYSTFSASFSLFSQQISVCQMRMDHFRKHFGIII